MPTFNLIGPSYIEQSINIDAQKTVNMYIIYDKSSPKQISFAPFPGLKKEIELNSTKNGVRSLYAYLNNLYSVCGDSVYSLDSLLNKTKIGKLDTDQSLISVSNNTTQLFLVDGNAGYVYTFSTGEFVKVTDQYFPSDPLMIAYLDGFFAVCVRNSNIWYLSAQGDATTWPQGSNALLESRPDTFMGIATINQRVILFGHISCEIWYNAGNADFPFSRNNNLIFEYGCAASGSIAKGFGQLFWMAADQNGVSSVMMTDGGTPNKISTEAIEVKLRNAVKVDDAIGFSFKEAGHVFYLLTLPTENITFLYDLTASSDLQMQCWYNVEMLDGNYYIAKSHAYFFGKHLVGSSISPTIYELSNKHYTNDGEAIKRERISTHLVAADDNYISISKLQISTQSGVCNPNPMGDEPNIFLSISNDLGHTYGRENKIKMGKIGQYKYKAMIYNIGTNYSYTFKIKHYDPTPLFITGASIEYMVNKSDN
ncbi:hypothetical protein E6Q11_01820 [Candidatus Dojkabacteria bacterium]|uniref:Uncharacterized protein n=1 Tax=Candidatus Dojkabacteria bacterium TaxID=2099670 RepID=A0A5C7J9Z0_9BACT|nr:MAG: hypothetical protein E6Q11_01820 [Candidatus Dojkabacteria bacterium]